MKMMVKCVSLLLLYSVEGKQESESLHLLQTHSAPKPPPDFKPPMPTTLSPAEECDPKSDDLCVWRHSDDDTTCGDDGCGNRAEFRKKFAELPPVEAPENAEPDDVIAENGGPVTDKQFHNLHFTKVSENSLSLLQAQNSIGDLGSGGIRYVDVTTLEVNGEDRQIDCIVTADGYTPYDASKNGLRGKVGNINLMHSTSVDLTFSFVDQATNEPATLGEFFFSVFDIDTGDAEEAKGAKETLTIGGYKEAYLIPREKGGQLDMVHTADGTSFTGSVHGLGTDNPTDPLVLSETQAQRTVNFKFAPGRSSFKFKYNLGLASNAGRNFQFAGMTNLYFCKAPKVNLNFSNAHVEYSNLGNKGPDTGKEGLLYRNVAQVGEQWLDLEVNAVTEYFPFNVDRNGLNGAFAQINLGTPCNNGKSSCNGATGTCDFTFSLKKAGTDDPYEAEWLYFSMFDLDTAKKNKKWNPKWQESMTVSGFASQYLSSPTDVAVEQLDKKTFRYNATVFGTGKDNPKEPMELNDLQKRRTVTFVYRATSVFKATFAIGLPHYVDGRNFQIAGKSATATCDQGTYGDVVVATAHVTPPP